MVTVDLEEASAADDIEQFVARTIVQPPPPFIFHTDHVTDHVNNSDIIVTSAGNSHVTSIQNVNNAISYRRAACIDKTAAMYVNLSNRRPSDVPPPPLLPHHSCDDDVNTDRTTDWRLQTTSYDRRRQYERRSLRWYDASVSRLAVCPTTSIRPTSLQHE